MIRRLLLAALLAAAPTVQAQEYPSRPIKIVAPFPAGGSADLIPRVIGEKLSLKWGQPVILEDRAGAAGNIGAANVFNDRSVGDKLLSYTPPRLLLIT